MNDGEFGGSDAPGVQGAFPSGWGGAEPTGEALGDVAAVGAVPFPWRSDWWRCLRFQPVSGRYRGLMSSPNPGKYELELRVDVDRSHANAPVMNRLSGDVYQVYEYRWFGRVYRWRVYRESWIVDAPSASWAPCSVRISGRVRYWKGGHPTTDVGVTIPWSGSEVGPANVTFSESWGAGATYTCAKESNAFRAVNLEVDVCKSVNAEPILPVYDTDGHPTRPVGLPRRTLTIEAAYAEAGIEITVNEPAARTIIEDSASTFDRWSPAELHDAMEQHFSRYMGRWPNWHLWCLLAGTFDSPSVGGIMFDAAAAFGGAGVPPERQGCAVFRNHSWFDRLDGSPATNAEQEAMRKLLYTYVHEIGHAFNFLHSWDKSRPDALSWMNYDWKYDNRNGSGSFWSNFRFRFDDEELIHLRHGDRAAVIMGGDPWASGGHMESPGHAFADLVGPAPLELKIRSKEYFHFMEPVVVELRIRNLAEFPMEVDARLHPEFGGVVVYIRRPDGRIVEFSPILCKLAPTEPTSLGAPRTCVEGEDRHSENVTLSYGAYGFYFDEPGEYQVRAVYQGDGTLLIPSNVHRLRVGTPFARDEEKVAQDYFSYEAGMALYLSGSSSPFLEKGMETLEAMAERFGDSPVGAHLAMVLGENLSRSFHRIEAKEAKLVEARPAEPERSLEFVNRALAQQRRDATTFTNLGYHALHRARAVLMAELGQKTQAKKDLRGLVRDLARRGVNQPVLDEIGSFVKSL